MDQPDLLWIDHLAREIPLAHSQMPPPLKWSVAHRSAFPALFQNDPVVSYTEISVVG